MEEREKAQARLDAIEIGRKAGIIEAQLRREDDENANNRMRRAMAYAAWDFDGRPEGNAHLLEFNVAPAAATPSLERPRLQAAKLAEVEPANDKPKRRLGGRRS